MASTIICLLALAGCDGASRLGGGSPAQAPLSQEDLGEPSALRLSGSTLGGSTTNRAVAVVPSASAADAPFPPVVVRGRDLSAAATPPNGARQTGKPANVSLSFAGADIRDVLAAVLGDTLKLNYIVDPEISGPVTFNVNGAIAREEILPLLETVLNSRGATMVQANGIIRVLPNRKDQKLGPVAPIPDGSAPVVGQRTQVFPLRFVAASEMQHVLEKVLPPGSPIAPDDKRQLIAVQGSPAELQLALDTIRVFDVDQLSGRSMALVALRNGDPRVVADELKQIFAATRKEADSDAIRFMAVNRLNAVMVISRSSHYLDDARSWIARLDRSRNLNERRVYVYNLQYAKAAQVGQKLQGLLTGLDIQFKPPAAASPEGLAAPAATENGQPASATKIADAKPTADPAIAALFGSIGTLAASAGERDRGGVRIESDEAHNALLISASARDYELIRQVLDGLDVPPLQVLIEVTVAEVALNDKLNYGVEYFIRSGNFNGLLTTKSNPFGIVPPTPGLALSWVTGRFQPQVILEALSEVTETQVISTPRLLVLSNQTARLQVGDVVPIITQSATSTVTSNPLVLNNVTYKETGVVLEVTPRVNSGGLVTMDINQAVSDVVSTTTSNIDSPTIRQRRLSSTISVKSGDAILLGGLIQQSGSRGASGIPGLNEIPVVGTLFGTRLNKASRTELIMLMKPLVIADEDQARAVTARVEREFGAVLDVSAMPPPRRPR